MNRNHFFALLFFIKLLTFFECNASFGREGVYLNRRGSLPPSYQSTLSRNSKRFNGLSSLPPSYQNWLSNYTKEIEEGKLILQIEKLRNLELALIASGKLFPIVTAKKVATVRTHIYDRENQLKVLNDRT